ncbi:MAG: sulfite dehydrogenase [Alphaproteobacteria bacterium]|jgi:sulfane dehydrogenase subunit SoxC
MTKDGRDTPKGKTVASQTDRRNFLKKSLMGSAAVAGTLAGGSLLSGNQAAAQTSNLPPNLPEWTGSLGQGVVANPYGHPSEFEKTVVRRNVAWLTASTESSVSFTPLYALHGIITPSGLAFERHHAGIPEIDPNQHRLILHGLVKEAKTFTMDDLMRFPSVSRVHFVECAANSGMEWRGAQLDGVQFTHGMVMCSEWTGVKLSTLLDECGIDPKGKWILAEGADNAAMTRSIPIAKALDDVIVAYAQNGEMLRPEQGYPVRLIVPGFEGNMNVKWLRRLKIGDKPWFTREETSKYTDLMADGKARMFTWVQDAKSVITFPCPERRLKDKGYYEISGLAWSGRGKITHVDVTTDGGKNWQPAKLQTPVLSKSLTRFRFDWHWDGSPTYMESRCVDETGYVQPTIDSLRKARGVNPIYHNNSIQTWKVFPNGEVHNVQIA